MRTPSCRRVGTTLTLTGVAVLAFGVLAPAASAGQGEEVDESPKVTLCHRTNSNTNPYIEITVDLSGANGASDHFNEHQGPIWDPTLKKQHIEWGDIIPPTDAHPEGLNWEEGEAWLENDCNPPPEEPVSETADISLAKALSGAAAPAANTDFTFTVVCDGDEAARPPVVLSPADGAVVIAEDIAVDDACTITETEDSGATSTSFAVNGGAPVAGPSVTVTVTDEDADETIAVVATNGFTPEVIVTTTTTTVQTQVLPTTLVQNTTSTTAAQVLGVQLARTGSSDGPLALFAFGLVLLGGGVALLGDSRRNLLSRRSS